MTDGLKASLMTPKLTAAKLAKVALQDQVGSLLGRRPKLIPAVGAPGELALMSAPGRRARLRVDHAAGLGLGQRGRRARGPEDRPLPARAARRRHRVPAARLRLRQDSLVDVKASDQVAHDAPQGEVAHYPIGHFEIYTGEWFERAVSRQAEFLARHLS